MRLHERRRRFTAFAALALLGLGACADEDGLGGPEGLRNAADVEMSVKVSSVTAQAGERITVAVAARPLTNAVVGALQGELRYDASQLEFVGQIIDQAGAMAIINDSRADRGTIRMASLHPTGLTERVGVFAFEVRGPRYVSNLRFEPEVVGTVETTPLRARVARDVEQDAALPSPSNARRMTYIDWAKEADPALRAMRVESPLSHIRGLPSQGALYGDVTLNGIIDTFDGADVANVGVGNRELIIGTDTAVTGSHTGPVDRVVVANVRPANTGSSCLPGFESTAPCRGRNINVFDAQPIVRHFVGFSEAVVGTAVQLPKSTWVSGDTVFVGAQEIDSILHFTADKLYVLTGVLIIGDEDGGLAGAGELRIDPGTTIEGDSLAAIYVTRNGRLIADGTATAPITFSCRANQRPTGPARFPQCWGGVFIAGNSVLNEQDATLPGGSFAPAIPGRNPTGGQNQRAGEGGAVNYGGGNDADSSGVIRYSRFLYGGRNVTPNNELNNLTIGACGTGTKLEYIQVHGGSDDGLELFGGRCDVRYLYASANDDDQFDYSFGYDGNVQFVVIQMARVGNGSHVGGSAPIAGGDKGNEVDNTETPATYNNLPRVNAQVYNLTYVGQRPEATKVYSAMHYRRGSGGTLRNFLIVGAATGWLIDDAATCTLDVNNIVLIDVNTTLAGSAGCPSVLGANIASVAAGGQLKAPFDIFLPDIRPVGDGVTVGFAPATPPSGGFFDTSATYFGGVAPATLSGNVVPWYAGWIVPWQSAAAW